MENTPSIKFKMNTSISGLFLKSNEVKYSKGSVDRNVIDIAEVF